MRLIPATKLKPDTGSPFHGHRARRQAADALRLGDPERRPRATSSRRAANDDARRGRPPARDRPRSRARRASRRVSASSKPARMRRSGSARAISTSPHRRPNGPRSPSTAANGSTSRSRNRRSSSTRAKSPTTRRSSRPAGTSSGDPKETLSTPRGSFKLQSKHVAAAMDSEENSSVSGGQRAHASGHSESAKSTARAPQESAHRRRGSRRRRQAPPAQHRQGRDPEVRHHRPGVAPPASSCATCPGFSISPPATPCTAPTGTTCSAFPRSHGCVNLSPIDAPCRLPLDRSARARRLARHQRRLGDGRRHRRHHPGSSWSECPSPTPSTDTRPRLRA